ncbi:MAG: hypothetical protein DI603_22245 [Roseateles depolymerans]|uniref:Ig-like SoxY domain-containing protein n=1 Tax=Roseateles depolymerans TaxID=76731 RepID=A0A2W5DFV7_9BURK|nr:MAG: hypothetical protein DI603_22245 [Roseateles depolymerans]
MLLSYRAVRVAAGATLLAFAGSNFAQSTTDEALDRAKQAKTLTDALAALGVTNPEPGNKVLLEAPDIVVIDRKFPVKVTSRMPGTDWVALFVERGTEPFVKLEEFPAGADRELSAEVRLPLTAKLRAVVRSGGKYYQVSREVKVATPAGKSK